MKFVCSRNHKTARCFYNYITKIKQCGKAYCTANIETIVVKESGTRTVANWTTFKRKDSDYKDGEFR